MLATKALPVSAVGRLMVGAAMGVLCCCHWMVAGAATGTAATAATSRSTQRTDFSGVWVHVMGSGIMPTRANPTDKDFVLTDGTVIPLRPEAEKIYRERVAMSQTEHPFAHTASRCLPIGTPGNMMGAPYPVQIVQRPEFIVMLFEEGWVFRTIYMNAKHPPEIVPSFMGHSIGRWEGKTLVIDTVAMRDDTTLNFIGLPHSENMRVVERITRTSPDTLTDLIQIVDPATYRQPFTFTSIFKTLDEDLIEYICEDGRVAVTPDGRQTSAAP